MIEMATLMSDYRTAYHVAHPLLVDFKLTESARKLTISIKDTTRLISVLLYLQGKLKMFTASMDLYESFIGNEQIMTKCNPFTLYYIIKYMKDSNEYGHVHFYQTNYWE